MCYPLVQPGQWLHYLVLFGGLWLFSLLPAAAQPASPAVRVERLPAKGLPLTTGWRYHAGDDPAWARPDFDDRRWQELDLGRPQRQLPARLQTGISWLRLRLRVGDSLRQHALLLQLGALGAWQLYLNGRLLQHKGTLDPDPTRVHLLGHWDGPESVEVPLTEPGEQVLALRFAPWRPPLMWGIEDNALLSLRLLAGWQARAQAVERGPARTVHCVVAGVFGMLTLLHLAFFRYNPARRANLYFALYAGCLALGALGIYYNEVFYSADLTPHIALSIVSYALLFLSSLAAVRALYALFHFRPGRLYAGLWLSFGGLLVFISLNLFGGGLLGYLASLVLATAEELRLTGRALRQRQRGAWIIGAGFAGSFLAVLTQVVLEFGPFGVSLLTSNLLFTLTCLPPALGISLFLAREFALDAELLQVKLAEVEQLAAQTLTQEQDKQALLAQQNETLERQVAQRTHQLQRSLTDLQASQQQLAAQAVRLGELDVAKNQFFANVSHELRTPLTLVLGPLDSLLTDPAQPLPAPLRPSVVLAHRQTRRLQALVDRILDLTKLQAGRLEIFATPTLVGPFLRRVVAQFDSLAAERGVALQGPDHLPPALQLLLDADKVEQILTNLLSNALKHTPAGGRVHLTAELPAAEPPHALTLTVRDTGPGIAADEQVRVFERFYQSPHLPTLGGTGLGLALSRELASLLGGTLTLDSTPGQGAGFTLRLPAPVLPPAPVEEPGSLEGPPAATAALAFDGLLAATGVPGSRLRVLVVEDHPDLRAYVRDLLAPTYEVLTAVDGQDALEVLAREMPVDLVATDAMMPRLSGTELLARLKANPTHTGVPVLMLTARADEAHRAAALTLGVDDYLTKPFTPAELLTRVRTLLQNQQVRRYFATLPAEPAADSPAASPADWTPATAAQPPVGARLPKADTRLVRWQAQATDHLADEQFGPAELASLLCLSERTLYRRLGELAGLTPAAWLRELRLDQARLLLEAGGFGSVTQVAEAVGFASARYFATLYTERFGRRPTDYQA
ncbi:MAG: ATP-binding protein [Janthinobacterium lividum]